MSTIVINGKPYSGNNIVVTNGKVTIDGKDETPETKEINISVEGNIEKLKVDSCNVVSVTGAVTSVSTVSGKVKITGNVSGGVQTVSGNVDCGDVGGPINSVSGNIRNNSKEN